MIFSWRISFQDHIDPLSYGWRRIIATHLNVEPPVASLCTCSKPRVLRWRSGRPLGSPAQPAATTSLPSSSSEAYHQSGLGPGDVWAAVAVGALGKHIWLGKKEKMLLSPLCSPLSAHAGISKIGLFFPLITSNLNATKCDAKWVTLQLCDGILYKIPLGSSS